MRGAGIPWIHELLLSAMELFHKKHSLPSSSSPHNVGSSRASGLLKTAQSASECPRNLNCGVFSAKVQETHAWRNARHHRLPLLMKSGTYTFAGDVRSPPPLLVSLLLCSCCAACVVCLWWFQWWWWWWWCCRFFVTKLCVAHSKHASSLHRRHCCYSLNARPFSRQNPPGTCLLCGLRVWCVVCCVVCLCACCVAWCDGLIWCGVCAAVSSVEMGFWVCGSGGDCA